MSQSRNTSEGPGCAVFCDAFLIWKFTLSTSLPSIMSLRQHTTAMIGQYKMDIIPCLICLGAVFYATEAGNHDGAAGEERADCCKTPSFGYLAAFAK